MTRKRVDWRKTQVSAELAEDKIIIHVLPKAKRLIGVMPSPLIGRVRR